MSIGEDDSNYFKNYTQISFIEPKQFFSLRKVFGPVTFKLIYH